MGADDHMSTPAIAYTGPTIDPEVPFQVRRHLQLIYQKLGNHTQAFQLQQAKINAIKGGTSTTIVEGGGSGGGSIIPFTPQPGIPINNQSGLTVYSTVTGDNGALIVLSDASPIAVSLTPETPPWGCFICNQGAGAATLTPAALGGVTPTISYTGNPGAGSMPLLSGYGCLVGFDGSSWWALTMPIVPLAFNAVTHEFLTGYVATTGNFTAAQPAVADVTGAAPLASPALTGTPTAPTASPLTDDTQIATTAYADAAVAVETSRAETAEALLAPKASPTFTGTVTQPTPDVLTAATTATSATAGAASVLPATPAGYLEVSINGTVFKLPYYTI